MPRFFYMESKNVQKTRFSACLKTKSLYMVLNKTLKTHVETNLFGASKIIFFRVTFAKYSTLGIAHTFHQSW